jgi:uncharacterized circularly permuted ATP-grasp superfamily protein/uncharacterized alpha-E superfamily protein
MDKYVTVGLLESYKSTLNSYDEVIDQNGQVKPYWQQFFNTLENIGMDVLETRNTEIINKLRENGVTYNIYNSSNGLNRPWKLDPIPFLIHQNEWNTIEKGIKQRAHLMDLIIKDLYGPQLLIKKSIIPPELLYDNLGFLRPCFDINQKLETQLLLYACDLARGPDGKMWLLDNRIQTPSGSGYALENRTVLANTFPELNKNIYRSKLSPYFNHLQDTVDKLANLSNENANVVILTPGPGNETYFEHVFLSSYLGYTLVQGNDLLVREGYVWLKSIDQLVRVDVIINRVDDEWSDPLELRENSLLGVPGLLQVMRLGNVSVLNPPGAAVGENFGFMAFMQNASKFLLNEPLLLNSVATWWCGQAKELNYVLANIPKLIIKKTNRKQGFRSIYGRLLSGAQIEKLRQIISKNPKEYVAQEEVSLSTTPSYINGKIEPRFAAIRAFMVSNGTDYEVMQGGLTRSSAVKDKFEISNQQGGLSKDTWIVTDQPTQQYIERISTKISTVSPNNYSITSRMAENLFWVGRLFERTVEVVGFLKIILNRLNENVHNEGKKQPEYLVVLLKSLTHLTETYPGFLEEEGEKDIFLNPQKELILLTKDVKRGGTVTYNLNSLINTIGQIKEKWNNDTRNIINLLDDSLLALKSSDTQNLNQVTHNLDNVYTNLFAFHGNLSETLPRDHGFFLFEAGKIIERIISLISVLRSSFSFKNEPEVELMLMEAVLENHHLLAQYRHINKSNFSLFTVLNMVLLDKNLPYTLTFLLDDLTYCLTKLPKHIEPNRLNIAEKTVLEASTMIKLIDTEKLVKASKENGYRKEFDHTLEKVYDLISQVTSNLSSLYFSHTVMQHSSIDKPENSEADAI